MDQAADKSIKKSLMIAALMAFFTPRIPFYKKRHRFRTAPTTEINSSYFKPHQGEQEKARRRRQIEKGMLRVTA